MKEHVQTVAALTVALLVAVVSIPLTTQALFRSQDQEGFKTEKGENVIQHVLDYKPTFRERTREYHEAMRMFQERTKDGEADLPLPDINDPESVAFYFEVQAEEEVASHGAATPSTTATIAEEDISDGDKALLRRYTRAHYCPESLKKYVVKGFYELCVSLVGSGRFTRPRTGIINDIANMRSKQKVLPNTLNNRLEMIRQAREGTKRESVGPSRMKTAAPQN